MTDDMASGLDTDRADSLDRFYDPSGITALGETPATAYTQINHVVKIDCSSTHRRIAKLRVAWSRPKPNERRGMCPKCGKMATYQFDTDTSHGSRA